MGLEHARSYDAAKVGRRTAGWSATGGSANAEIGEGLARIRNRCRDTIRNNEYAKRAVGVFGSNVVGYGISIVPKAPREAKAWKAWSDSLDCDADGSSNLAGLVKLAVTERFGTGEVLIRRRWRRAADGYAIPMQIQVLEADHLDESKTGPQANGNYCILGKEFDALGTCVAYWLFPEHPGEIAGWRSSSFVSKRVPASEVIHYYKRDRPSAVRGVSELAVSLMRYRDLGDWHDAELVRKKMEACVMAIISSDKPDKALGLSGANGVEKMRPGLIARIGASEQVTFNNPPPSGAGGEFSRFELHALAVGSGITYAQLTGDMSQANFSSNRMGLIEFRALIEQEQWLSLVPQVLQRIRGWWREAAALQGVQLGDQADDAYTMPAKPQVDPLKDTMTSKESVRGGFTTLSEVLRERGTTLDAYIAERQAELKKLQDAGLVLDTDAATSELGLTGADMLKLPPDA
jgi:lambda family phage portal protein